MSTKKPQRPNHARSSSGPDESKNENGAAKSSDRTAGLLHRVETLLDTGRAAEAFDLLRPATSDPVLKNARGVCLLRMGQPGLALRVYRELCLTGGGIVVRPDAPAVWKVNYANALLMDGNVAGCVGILNDLGEAEHPLLGQLRAAVAKWESELSLWQRLAWRLGTQPSRPVTLDFAPGALH